MTTRRLAPHTEALEGMGGDPWTGPSTGRASYLKAGLTVHCQLVAGVAGERAPGTAVHAAAVPVRARVSPAVMARRDGGKGQTWRIQVWGPHPGALVSPHLGSYPFCSVLTGLGRGLGVREPQALPDSSREDRGHRQAARPGQAAGTWPAPHLSFCQSPSPMNSCHPALPLASTQS